MTANKDDTERLIKETAKKIFFGEGRFNATTQEIADAAGVNRSLINYYFRSRDNLFALIFKDAEMQELEKTRSIVLSQSPFKEKIADYIERSLKESVEYPYLEIYLVTQINQGCIYTPEKADELMRIFSKELKQEIKKGTVEEISPEQFIINIISLVSYPVCMKSLFRDSLNMSEDEYSELLSQRKDIILKLIFKN